MVKCPECGSQRTWKDGKRYVKGGEIQRYLCRSCGYRFSQPKVKVNVAGKRFENSNPRNKNSHGMVLGSDFSIQKVSDDLSFPSCEDVGSHVTPHASTVEKALNSLCLYNRERRVGVSKPEAKNLAEKTSRIEKQAAGATTKLEVKGKIVEFLWYLKKQGKAQDTILNRKYMLGTLVKFGANLFDPENVKDAIARYPNWKKPSSKAQAVQSYTSFLEFLGLKWKPPKYKPAESLPFIPLEKELDTLIQNSGKVLAAFLQGLKDTGADPGELAGMKWIDVNPQSKTVAINHPVKGHNARILKVSDEFLARIKRIPKRKDGRIFAHARSTSSNMVLQRRRIAHAYENPRLLKITFRTFRHWKGTIEYHKTHDPYHVKKLLGHKRLQSTEIYINLEQAVFTEENDEFHVKAVKTLDQACKLVEVGFEYITDMDNYKIFRKRK